MNLFTRFVAILALIAVFVLIQSHVNAQGYYPEDDYGEPAYDDYEYDDGGNYAPSYPASGQINYTLIFYGPEYLTFRYRYYKPNISIFIHLGRTFWHPHPVIEYHPVVYRHVYYDPCDYIPDFYIDPVVLVVPFHHRGHWWHPRPYGYGGYYAPRFHKHHHHKAYHHDYGKGHRKYREGYGDFSADHPFGHGGKRDPHRKGYREREPQRQKWTHRGEVYRGTRSERGNQPVWNDRAERRDRQVQRRESIPVARDEGPVPPGRQAPPGRRVVQRRADMSERNKRHAQPSIPGSRKKYSNGKSPAKRAEHYGTQPGKPVHPQTERAARAENGESHRPPRSIQRKNSRKFHHQTAYNRGGGRGNRIQQGTSHRGEDRQAHVQKKQTRRQGSIAKGERNVRQSKENDRRTHFKAKQQQRKR